jgi:hypothetical protein
VIAAVWTTNRSVPVGIASASVPEWLYRAQPRIYGAGVVAGLFAISTLTMSAEGSICVLLYNP